VIVLVFFFCTAVGFGQRFIPSYQAEIESGKDQTVLRSDGCNADLPALKFEVKVSKTGKVVAVKERQTKSKFLTVPRSVLNALTASAKQLVASWRFRPFFVDHKPVAIRTIVAVPCKKE